MITLEQAVQAGCVEFARRGTLDLNELATLLSVSRATLYRVVGSRDALLAEVLWHSAQQCLDHARAQRTADGIDGVLQVVRAFARPMLASRALSTFIATEQQTAARVLGTPDGGVHRLAVAAVTELFAEVGLARRSGWPWRRLGPDDPAALHLVEEPEQVAYLLVKIVESLCFAELAGTVPDLDLAEQTIRDMLVRACMPRQSRLSRLLDAAMCVVWTAIPDSLFAETGLPMAFAA